MKINELFTTGYNWLLKLTSELLSELRKDKADIIASVEKNGAITQVELQDQTNTLERAILGVTEAVNSKEVAKEVKVANPEQISGEIVDGLTEVIKTLKEEIKKFDREIVVKNDLSSLLGLFKTETDKKDLIKALSQIEKKIKSPEITDYTMILSDIASLVENINLPKLDKVEKLLGEMCSKEMMMPDHMEKYSEKGRIKVVLSDKQLKEIGGGSTVLQQGGSNLSGVLHTNEHTGVQELRVYEENHICTGNTTTTPLGANATFTGEWQDCLNYQEVNVSIVADKNSATNGLVFQWSADGTTIGDTDVFSYYTASGGTNYTPNPAFRYLRMVYTNGAQAQGSFQLTTILRRSATGGSFHRIDSTLKDDADARLQITVPKLKTAANTYVSQTATTAGNAKMSVQEFDAAVATDTNKMNVAPYLTDENGVQSQMLTDTYFGGAPVTIETEHHEIHCGDSLSVSHTVDLGNGATRDILIIIPDPVITSKRYHFYIDIVSELETDYKLYEAPTTTGNGTTVAAYNRNRQDPVVAENEVTFFHTPTVTGVGTLIDEWHWGSGRLVGGASRGQNEWVFKNNTKYLIRVTNATVNNNYVDIKINYYVHPGV